jgi:hypothetical protein
MTTACYSVRQGAVGFEKLGGRAVWLVGVVSLVSFGSLSSAFAADDKEAAADRKSRNVAAEKAHAEKAVADKADDDRSEPAVEIEVTETTVHSNESADSKEPTVKVADAVNVLEEAAEPEVVEEDAVAAKIGEPTIRHIGPVTTITEVSSGLPFPARVDTGATTCSIHYEAMEIENPAKNPADNVGKRVRVLIRNDAGDEQWINTKIADHVTVRTTNDDDERYKVELKLRWQDVEKQVLVTLKDREKMRYPLLVGRNFLRGDFLVDVNLEGDAK